MSADTLTPPSVKRTVLFSASGREAPAKVDAEMKRLEELHLRTFKRKLDPSILFISHLATSALGITAYTRDDQHPTLQFLHDNVTLSPALLAA